MARRKVRHNEKPWIRDPAVVARWQVILDNCRPPVKQKQDPQPKAGWQLFRWDTLEDVPQ
jgi:hypothetical protein